jgi:hypothetical protein
LYDRFTLCHSRHILLLSVITKIQMISLVVLY